MTAAILFQILAELFQSFTIPITTVGSCSALSPLPLWALPPRSISIFTTPSPPSEPWTQHRSMPATTFQLQTKKTPFQNPPSFQGQRWAFCCDCCSWKYQKCRSCCQLLFWSVLTCRMVLFYPWILNVWNVVNFYSSLFLSFFSISPLPIFPDVGPTSPPVFFYSSRISPSGSSSCSTKI